MKIHEKYIKRCLELAKNGLTMARPNPSVGCVIVHKDSIIGEGFTSTYGGPHAEVNAIAAVKESSMLKKATLYVSLEPCNHFGKTPPCTQLIIESGIKKVVIGCVDPNKKVSGKGIQKLKENGCTVTVGVLERECLDSHRRFFTYQTKKRPFIILKWAESKDGFIDVERKVNSGEIAQPNWITNTYSRQLVHKWRSEEAAILVGTNTAINDNPSLTVRDWKGPNPVRIVMDRALRVPKSHAIYNKESKTIVLTSFPATAAGLTNFEQLNFSENVAEQIVELLYRHQLISVIIEGGAQTLQTFIDAGLWDEARIFKGAVIFSEGIPAPKIVGEHFAECTIGQDHLTFIKPPRN